jgi:5-methylcytosine-specific restriction endonuclease McrA
MVKTREEYNAYMRAYNKARYHRLRSEIIEQLGGKCIKCGSTTKLELDHKDCKTKSINMSSCLLHGDLVVADEVDKLQLLCYKCHDAKTITDLRQRATKGTNVHGTLSSVRYCKCNVCRLTKAIYNKYRLVVPYSIIQDLFPQS